MLPLVVIVTIKIWIAAFIAIRYIQNNQVQFEQNSRLWIVVMIILVLGLTFLPSTVIPISMPERILFSIPGGIAITALIFRLVSKRTG
jgi:hypothetical protein